MRDEFGPLLDNPKPIEHAGRQYWVGSAFNAFEGYVEIGGVTATFGDNEISHDAIVHLPAQAAVKIAAAILLSHYVNDPGAVARTVEDGEVLNEVLGCILSHD